MISSNIDLEDDILKTSMIKFKNNIVKNTLLNFIKLIYKYDYEQ